MVVVAQDPRVPRRPTYADIEALPRHVVGEIIDGELVVSPRPSPAHTRSASRLGALLSTAFELGVTGPGGWWVHFEPELSLGVDPDFDPLVPDLAGWRIETMPELPVTAQYKAVPDWVCEVISPSTAGRDRVAKLPFFTQRAGVGHVWLLDPLAQTLELYVPGPAGAVLTAAYSGATAARIEPFAAIELDLGLLWGRPRGPAVTE